MNALIVANFVFPGSTTRCLELLPEDLPRPVWEPGAGCTLRLGETSRAFSFAGHPDDLVWRFLIREVPGGEFHDLLATRVPGDRIVVEELFHFFPVGRTSGVKTYFFATGVAVAPFLSAMLCSGRGPDYFFYGARSAKDLVGLELIERLVPDPSSRLIFCSEPDAGPGIRPGRFVQEITPDKIDPSGIFFLCGIGTMINEVSGRLMAMGVGYKQILSETFFPG